MKGLTKKQSKIIDFIVEWQIKRGYPPTQKEILDHFGFGSLNAVRSHLLLIEKKGYLRINIGKARGIQLLTSSISIKRQQEKTIPILGNIAAGIPILAEENLEDYLPVQPAMFGGGDLFALHIHGESMTGAGIRNGDIAIIKMMDHVENGEIAAVLIEQEATLKRVYSTSNSLVLKSENPAFKDLTYNKDKNDFIRILGRYQGIIRTIDHRSYS